MGRTIAIGDIHGCLAALQAVLEAIQPAADDLVITLGDYIDRGPDSKGVISRLLKLKDQCQLIPLLGNHELMLHDVLAGELTQMLWLSCGGRETLQSYSGHLNDIPRSHRRFLDSCVKYYETANHIFLHANYDPDCPADEQPDDLAFWQHITHFRPAPHYSGKTVVVGHTPQYSGEILDMGHAICIDTFCFGSGYLTAYDVDTGHCWQADRTGRLRSDS